MLSRASDRTATGFNRRHDHGLRLLLHRRLGPSRLGPALFDVVGTGNVDLTQHATQLRLPVVELSPLGEGIRRQLLEAIEHPTEPLLANNGTVITLSSAEPLVLVVEPRKMCPPVAKSDTPLLPSSISTRRP